MNGANRGPEKTATENRVTAIPLVRLLNISAKTAATIVNGAAPINPPKKRHINTVCRSFPTATATEKTENPKEDIMRGTRRPYSSEIGAHRIGPVANPRTYSEMPKVPTSVETPKSAETTRTAAEKTLLPNAAVSVTKPSTAAITSLDPVSFAPPLVTSYLRPRSLFPQWPILCVQSIIYTIEFYHILFPLWQRWRVGFSCPKLR